MTQIKNLFFIFTFMLLGAGAFASTTDIAENPSPELSLETVMATLNGCGQTHLDCDAQYPEDYTLFAACMENAGCGGGAPSGGGGTDPIG